MSRPGGDPGAVTPVSIEDYGAAARDVLAAEVWEYIAGGAGEELTVAANRDAFRRVALKPRCLVDVSRPRLATTVLGAPVRAPVGVAPLSYHRLVHPEGELATARAAAAEGLVMVVSMFASQRFEEVARAAAEAAGAATGLLWVQLYALRDRSLMEELVRRAEQAGYGAVVLTVDMPVMGARHRDLRSGFRLPAGVEAPNLPAADGPSVPGSWLARRSHELVDPGFTWRDLEWLRSVSRLPLVLKGVMTAADAARAAEHGVEAIVVSNHGGRQLDGAQSSLEALGDVADEVGAGCELLLDGGVRGGSDVLKALALGARSVLVGRPVLWGLAVAGEVGVKAVLRRYTRELKTAMALAGCPVLDAATAELVARGAGR